MATQDYTEVAKTHYDAFNARDFQRAVTVVDENVQWHNVASGQTFQGIPGYQQFIEGWETAFPDGAVEIQNIVPTDNGVVVEYIGRGTNTGSMETPDGTIEPTGKSIELKFCEVLSIQNGKIADAHLYFDSATMMRQLGLLK